MLNPRFGHYTPADLRLLVEGYPLAWVMAPGASIATATPLPLLGRYDDAGRLCALVGHMARRNPLHKVLRDAPGVHILFTGPQGYVSPEHSGRRDWGPTWNYAVLRIEAELIFEADKTAAYVEELVELCEEHRDHPWTSAEIADRREGMMGAIIGFTARVTGLDATFKLAQDESDDVLVNLASAHPDEAMRTWICALNTERLAKIEEADG